MKPSEVSYPTCLECEGTNVFVRDGKRYCWDCFTTENRFVAMILPEGLEGGAAERRSSLYVYLSGGLHGYWQDRVMGAVPDAIYYNPKMLMGLWDDDMRSVVATELRWIQSCSIVFAYMERDNPSGVGLATELGYAKALGKYTILVCEKLDRYDNIDRYWMFPALVADYHTRSLKDGIKHLKEALERYPENRAMPRP